MYCPECKLPIKYNKCTYCGFVVVLRNEIPILLSDSIISRKYKEIGKYYDDLYDKVDDAWNKIASRGPEFIEYISDLVMKDTPVRYLDIGCGEGYLLAAVNAKEKYGIDISQKALEVAISKGNINVCVGFAEEMPFPDNYFDTVSSIGVMTHFIEDVKATKEINRVLKASGKYILGIYLKPSLYIRLYDIIRKIVIESSGIGNMVSIFYKKVVNRIKNNKRNYKVNKQPIETMYTRNELIAKLESCGFFIVKEITKLKNPATPLPGNHFRVYVLQK